MSKQAKSAAVKAKQYDLTVYRCPEHRQFMPLVLEEVDGNGTRMLGGKCCVRLYEQPLVKYRLTVKDCEALIRELENIVEDLESNP